MTTSAYLRWKDLDNRLEAARRAHNIPEMQSILGLMTELLHRWYGHPKQSR